MNEELLPCPICGGDAVTEDDCDEGEVGCDNPDCDAYGEAFYRETWNARASYAHELRLRVKALEGK